jgi:hypothetical protein
MIGAVGAASFADAVRIGESGLAAACDERAFVRREAGPQCALKAVRAGYLGVASAQVKAKVTQGCTGTGTEVYHTLKATIVQRYGALSASVGDEGGFAPDLADLEEALALVCEAAARAGHADSIKIALDVAASEIADRDAQGQYAYRLRPGEAALSTPALVALYQV